MLLITITDGLLCGTGKRAVSSSELAVVQSASRLAGELANYRVDKKGCSGEMAPSNGVYRRAPGISAGRQIVDKSDFKTPGRSVMSRKNRKVKE